MTGGIGDELAEALITAEENGVEVCAFDCDVTEKGMEIKRQIVVVLGC